MVAPSRDDKTYAIACGSLSGFGGFLKQSFRAHDYFLGRRNMQKFLRDHFVLPENNPLFNSWTMDMREAYYVRNSDGAAELHEGFRMLPVIPLVGEARTPCHQAQWPEYTQEDLDKLTEQLERRLDMVFERLVKQYFSGNNWAVRSIAKLVLGRKKKDVVGFALKKVSDSLRKMELMRS